MLKDALAYVLPLLLWGAASGVLNLIFTRKSQIETWVNAHPRLAAWSKLLRSIGFDPWAAHAWLTLLVKKKLPEAQQANSKIAKVEQAKADAKRLEGPDDEVKIGPLLVLLAAGLLGLSQQSCSPAALPPPCDEASASKMAGECAAEAAVCVTKGGTVEDCSTICDARADERARQCR